MEIGSRFGGSSIYRVIDNELITIVNVFKETKPKERVHEVDISKYDPQAFIDGECLVQIDYKPIISEGASNAGYKLKKSKIILLPIVNRDRHYT